jgi:hypothetical protein
MGVGVGADTQRADTYIHTYIWWDRRTGAPRRLLHALGWPAHVWYITYMLLLPLPPPLVPLRARALEL